MNSFQLRSTNWARDCFGQDVISDKYERACRFLEEALELAQACGLSEEDAGRLVAYTFGRPIGDPAQEVGQVMNVLAILSSTFGLDMDAEAAREMDRISTPEMMAKIKAKHDAKPIKSPLPGRAKP